MSRSGQVAGLAAGAWAALATPCFGDEPPGGAAPCFEKPPWGALTGYDIQLTVRRHRPQVRRACFERALHSRPEGAPTSARVVVLIDIERSGKVGTVAISGGSTKGYPDLGRCVVSQVQTWRFPKSTTATRTSVPFAFDEKITPEEPLPPKPPRVEPYTAATLTPIVDMLMPMVLTRCLPNGEGAPDGKVVVTVAASGQVTRAVLRGGPLPGTSTGTSIERALLQARFPSRSDKPVTVTLPLRKRPAP